MLQPSRGFDSWSRFYDPTPAHPGGEVIICRGELYFIPDQGDNLRKLSRVNSANGCYWEAIPYEEQRIVRKVFARNEEEIYILSVSKLNETTCPEEYKCCSEVEHEHVYFIAKYKHESNSWEEITSFNVGSRGLMCVVAIYLHMGQNSCFLRTEIQCLRRCCLREHFYSWRSG